MAVTTSDLRDAANISQSHAHMILSGDRQPSLAVALKIYDATGQQFGILKGLSPDTIAEIRKQAA